ncbi:hypothetical protein [Comamonas sp. 26]|uniref:hypothetical protein n=1 Tax=Comamonas sp. 26 TaxID=2035201 RepID=UPI000C19E8E2|nr:hypothetical protein [Comamonas sp. 26]PIG09828.1 hypothetical protein CLU84_2791 [Comamonas sp. 26]
MIDSQRVPAALRHLIPLAQKFGISDDLAREAIVSSSSMAEIKVLKQAVQANNALLDAWLAGPEATDPCFSNEYIAFSAMRMAADFA